MELDGLLVIDKPGGMTSREAVNCIQRHLPRRTRIGHTGTLDPLATGVLVICLGQATRLAEYVQAMRKRYQSTFLLGSTSDTDDADGVVTQNPVATPLPVSTIDAAINSFVGEIEQVPPAYSAAKIDGRRAYDLARKGAEIDLKPRRVTIYDVEIKSYQWPNLEVEVSCSKGTYIRSLARDIGARLGCGGIVAALRRTAVGQFTPQMATPLDAPLAVILEKLRPTTEAVGELPRIEVSEIEADHLRCGRAIRNVADDGTIATFLRSGELIAICECTDGLIRPSKVLSR